MTKDKMRADFEVWECVSDAGPQTDPVWLMYDETTNTFPMDKIQERWKTWQASRAAIEVVLPKRENDWGTDNWADGYNLGVNRSR